MVAGMLKYFTIICADQTAHIPMLKYVYFQKAPEMVVKINSVAFYILTESGAYSCTNMYSYFAPVTAVIFLTKIQFISKCKRFGMVIHIMSGVSLLQNAVKASNWLAMTSS